MFRFRLDGSSGVPPYLQLVHQVRQSLLLGYLQEGDRLPTVKDVAADLVINPNTTAAMTATIEAAARAVAAPDTQISAATSAIGPVSIEGFYDEAFAVPGVIAALREARDADAAIIACFDDTGLDAARSFAAYPVVGICEAGLVTAAQVSKRIGVVTTLSRSIVPLEELVGKYGFAERARVYACDVPVLELEAAGSGARAKIEQQIAQALQNGADSILLGCAAPAHILTPAATVRRIVNMTALTVVEANRHRNPG